MTPTKLFIFALLLAAGPVVLVINENGQGHASLGNGYWKKQGVPVPAHADAIHEIEESGAASLARLKRVTREKAENTRVDLPTETFSDKRTIELGNIRSEVQALLDSGDDLQAAYEIDQSRYAHLDTFEELASRNAGRVFEQMEFE